MTESDDKTTHFGFETVKVSEKAERVREVFHSVAQKYDIMNDMMSLGVHRHWKALAVKWCQCRPGQHILDLAGGTGDLTTRLLSRLGPKGRVTLADINAAMLQVGRDRLIDLNQQDRVQFVQADAQQLPFPNNYDRIIIGFGLRNVTDKQRALKAMFNVLKPGGHLIVLEFSTPTFPGLSTIYEAYSFKLLPLLGKHIANDADSYRYLAESIRMHPDQETLKKMMEKAGFEDCSYHNLSGGIVAIHKGCKYG